jgi:hypothetical protein
MQNATPGNLVHSPWLKENEQKNTQAASAIALALPLNQKITLLHQFSSSTQEKSVRNQAQSRTVRLRT